MIKKILFSFLILVAIPTFATVDPMTLLEQRLSHLNRYAAQFEQKTYSGKKLTQTTVGKVMLKRPGYFRWEVLKPLHQIIIANPHSLWVYDVDLEQATHQKITPQKDNTLATLLSGSNSALKSAFQIQDFHQAGSKTVFRLSPKDVQSTFESVTLTFQGNTLVALAFRSNIGQDNQILFGKIQTNPNLNTSLFEFKPGPEVDVLNQ